MTMYITVATADRVIQASDCRATSFRQQVPRVCDDSRIKAVIVVNPLGQFGVVYSGLGEINRISTDNVIADIFQELNARCRSPSLLFDRFIDTLSARFRAGIIGVPSKHRELLRTCLSAAGYLRGGNLFYLRISNHVEHTGQLGELRDTFHYTGRLIDNPTPKDLSKGTYIEIGGIASAHAKRILNERMRELKRRRFFHRVSGEAVADELVRIIREFAKGRFSRGLVGANCITTVLNAPPATQHSFRYHSIDQSPIRYGPHFVVNGGGIRDFRSAPIPGNNGNA